MPKRLIVLFDGTWNTLEDQTNVVRVRDGILKEAPDGVEQRLVYIEGVGTNWYDRVRGGAFGLGLSDNIQKGYRWLAENWAADDSLYVFGFSRGAYSARSLVGLIRKCGVLRSVTDSLVDQAYDLYRDKDIHPDDPRATSFRASHSQEIRVKFIGVWDTVGCLGIPATGIPWGRDQYRWHDTALSKIVEYAYHALAIDEHRRDYEATLWTEQKPENHEVEQRWFVGAHANVGGGYTHDRLCNIPLRWLQQKAEQRGLAFKEPFHVNDADYRFKLRDSFSEFMYGIYKVVKFGSRHHRPVGTGVSETVDDSVWQRWKDDPSYRPPSLKSRAQAQGLPT